MPEVLTQVDEDDSIEKFKSERVTGICLVCNGSGEVNNGVDFHWRPYWITCPSCKGTGVNSD